MFLVFFSSVGLSVLDAFCACITLVRISKTVKRNAHHMKAWHVVATYSIFCVFDTMRSSKTSLSVCPCCFLYAVDIS